MIIKVHSVGICGTDVHKIVHETIKPPIVLGHEVAGEVYKVGKNVTKFQVGDKVAAAHHSPCMSCPQCFRGNHSLCDQYLRNNFVPGGFCEYLKVDAGHIAHTVHGFEKSSFDEAAFMEPLGCCVRGLDLLKLDIGDAVLIQGAGPIGILHAQLAKLANVSRIYVTDFNQHRLQLVEKLTGASPINLNETTVKDYFQQVKPQEELSAISVTVGIGSVYDDSLHLAGRGARLLVFAECPANHAFPISPNLIYGKELQVFGSYSSSPESLWKALQLIEDRRIDVDSLISHRIPLRELQRGIELAHRAQEGIKIMINPFQE